MATFFVVYQKINSVFYILVQEKIEEQRKAAEEAKNNSKPDELRLNLNQLNDGDSFTEMQGPQESTSRTKSLKELEVKQKLVESENQNLLLKIQFAKEQRLMFQAKSRSEAPRPSAGQKLDENANPIMENESSVDETIQSDVLDCLDSDGISTMKTMSHSIEHEGYLNSREMLKNLEPHQQGVLSVIRLFFQNLAQLPTKIRSGGGQEWKKFVSELEQNKTNIEDVIDFNNREALKMLFVKVGDSTKELFKMCSPSSSIGTLLMMMQWMEQTSTKKLFGTNTCKSVLFSFKILAKQNRQMFQSDVNALASWRSVQDSRNSNREYGRNSFSPYARRGSGGNFGSYGASSRGYTRGNFRGSFRGTRGGRGRGRGSYAGGRGSYGATNTVRE